MKRSARSLLLCAAVSLPLAALAPIVARAAAPSARAHAAVQVTIQNFAFSPAHLSVAPGTTVTWTNKDSVAHTVTSDTSAWPDSGSVNTGQTFSFTFKKAGTYTYHCSIHPSMVGTVTVGAGSSSSGSSGSVNSGGMMGGMGPMSKLSMTVWTGYYDDHKVTYISTDTSSKAEAARDHINYSAALAKSVANAKLIYLVTNGAYANHGAVFGSEPGESDYTPLWQEVVVTWKNPSKAVALGSDNQINSLVKKGQLTLKMTGTVLNCPIIKVMSGGM